MTICLGAATCTLSQTLPYQNPLLSAEERAADLCSRLTLEEKTLLMMDRSPAIERLGIPQFEWWNETLHGVGRNGYATVFPITMGMAASFDDEMVHRVFTAASDEARAKNAEAKREGQMARYRGLSFWTPNINIFRDPRWGRGQETYGEDPFLTARMGLAVVRGLQGDSYDGSSTSTDGYLKLAACAKHYAVHSGPEWNRHQFDIELLPERDLWETYLPAFKTLVEEGNVKEVMCAYQRFDGQPCCGNTRLLQHILRDEWGFKGLVVSDCGAISDFWRKGRHGYSSTKSEASAKAVIAGTDVECGSDYKSLPEALKKGLISEEQIDLSVKRLLKLRFELGDFDNDAAVAWTQIPMSVVASKPHKKLALDMARKSIVLLKNNGILPLAKGQQKAGKIAVLGPNACDSTMLRGNYYGIPTQTTTIMQGILSKMPDARYIPGCGLTSNNIEESLFAQITTAEGKPGLTAQFWNNEQLEGTPAAQTIFKEPVKLENGGNTAFAPGVELEHFSASLDGVFTPTQDGVVQLNIHNDEHILFIFDGDTLLNRWNSHDVGYQKIEQKVKAGKPYPIHIEYIQQIGLALLHFDITRKMEVTPAQIIDQTKDADVVIFVGGISPRLEGEEMKVNEEGFRGGDRTSIELPRVQREMLAALKKAGKRIVFVCCSGSAIGLVPETETTDAIVQAWYGGEAGGQAIADVIFGDYNPSGKLPVTFYKNVEQLPDYEDYTMKGRTYRYFQQEPLFPFGHGLSYTTFLYGKPQYKDGKVMVSIKNTGSCKGTETVEVYLKNPADKDGPLKTLRAYKQVQLEPGEEKTVAIDFSRERFEWWDKTTNTMRVIPGRYELMVGGSSDDRCLQTIPVSFAK